LGAAIKKERLGLILVGDLAQPRGGPTLTGHRSHQTGLDVDLSYGFPDWALRRRFTRAEREKVSFPVVVDLTVGKLSPLWQARIVGLLQAAAVDPAVDRIFVNPVIKRELCERAKPGSAWQRKLRPWWGHHDHFHVRLRCPPGSDECQAQDPLGNDDGCGPGLRWWFSADARATRERRAAQDAAAPPPLPARCDEILLDR